MNTLKKKETIMKVYKVELLIIDHDELGEDEIENMLENTNYPNHCINPSVMKIDSCDIGEWTDDHPLNNNVERGSCYYRLFY